MCRFQRERVDADLRPNAAHPRKNRPLRRWYSHSSSRRETHTGFQLSRGSENAPKHYYYRDNNFILHFVYLRSSVRLNLVVGFALFKSNHAPRDRTAAPRKGQTRARCILHKGTRVRVKVKFSELRVYLSLHTRQRNRRSDSPTSDSWRAVCPRSKEMLNF